MHWRVECSGCRPNAGAEHRRAGADHTVAVALRIGLIPYKPFASRANAAQGCRPAGRDQLGGTQALLFLVASANVMLDEQLASISTGRVALHCDLSVQSKKQ
jgi:hypothetical protein